VAAVTNTTQNVGSFAWRMKLKPKKKNSREFKAIIDLVD
jgi:hypothetical protein